MRLKNGIFLLSATAVLTLSGCFGSNAPAVGENGVPVSAPQQDPALCYEGGVQAPQWVCDPFVEGGMFAVGSAPANPLGKGFQQTEAMANARDSLARELGTKVSNMFKQFAQSTGVGENQTVEKVATNVSKQIASQNIEGARQKNRWTSPDGTLYIHVVMDPTSVATFKEEAKAVVKTSMKNDEALYQQFVAKRGFDELDAAIEKELGVSAK
jgi:hypothetical protein